MAENDNLTMGIAAVKSGKLEKASDYLGQAVKDNPDSAEGWLWLGRCLPTLEQRKYCYKKVLRLDPHNIEAQSDLDGLFLSNIAESSRRTSSGWEKILTSRRSNPVFLSIVGMLVVFLILLSFADAGLLDPLTRYLPRQGPVDLAGSSVPATTATVWQPDRPASSATLSPYSIDTKLREIREVLSQEKYTEAVIQLDQLIHSAPERHEAYYLRATGYHKSMAQQRSLPKYKDDLEKALADIDKAIAIQPYNGDYYMLRHYLLLDMAGLQDYRVDRAHIAKFALENARVALSLGTKLEQYPDHIYALDLMYMNRCEEALQLLQSMIDRTQPNDGSIGELFHTQSQAYICLEQVDKAIEMLDKSMLNNANMREKQELKVQYLYQAGRSLEALRLLNELIEQQPSDDGWRYYLRALIYQEMGQRQKAEDDLVMGAENTWSHVGLYSYVQGKLALEDEDTGEGTLRLQEAEATLDLPFMPLRKRIQIELEQLEAQPLQLTPYVMLSTTPMPPSLATPIPSVFFPPDADEAVTVSFAEGTGKITLRPNDHPLFRFHLGKPIAVKLVKSLTMHLTFAGNEPDAFDVRINFWRPREAIVAYTSAREDSWLVPEPEDLLLPDGDMFLSVYNNSTKTFVIKNMILSLVVETTDGQIITYSPE